MRIRKFSHSCLLVEGSSSRVLIDPGSFSAGVESIRDLSAVLVTHVHGDHLDVNRVARLIEGSPEVTIVCDAGSAGVLTAHGIDPHVMRDGDIIDVGMRVRAAGSWHAVIHPDIPTVENIGYMIDERIFHPGDAFTDPGCPVEVLAVPAGAPWMKISEAIDYLRAYRPAIAVPIHEAVLAQPAGAFRILGQLAPQGTHVHPMDKEEVLDIGEYPA